MGFFGSPERSFVFGVGPIVLVHTASTSASVNKSLMRRAHALGRFCGAMRLPPKQAGTQLARARKDSITGTMRTRLTTMGHVASGLGNIMVRKSLTPTNSDLVLSEIRSPEITLRIRGARKFVEQLRGRTQLSGRLRSSLCALA